ncbi:4-hydroxybenzoate polyprenyltransferase [Desulfurobacterium thermolithotrophum DSM 11699]|uniref:4-hydroxybenzoate polyprenyltransferase n=1 Tax=Desulfurobacterium thermolithotrophum (strain DSM 11699 / BSA) TaxID=868864 RepID=F0S3F8_DESTD|nr:UbiA-like polyprenyltransferase [Desulfurobacterium thermolithotrophum]ADY73380.1 4-hydroxybenzoate polyprenyltransferase [Desulfurobacterium thermolithotrophum DSM 11699]
MVMLNRIKNYMEMIKVEHTVFALPFALTSALIAANGFPSLYQTFWIIVALFGARTAAMSLNRLIDAEIDAKNPRTANRHIPRGVVKKTEVLVLAIVGFALMIYGAYKLNSLALKLSPIAVAVLTLYSFTKRFTWLCHIVLGVAIALAPFGAWVAIKGSVSLSAFLLSISVGLWVAGFDIIYALQDVEFDRKEGLYSIPAVLGEKRALFLSKVFHILTLFGLIWVGIIENLGFWYYLGLAISALFMLREHRIISKDKTKINYAFFNLNGYISLSIFLFTLLNYLWNMIWSS